MNFRELTYQQKVLRSLERYLDELQKQKANADKVKELSLQNPDIPLSIPDFAEETWLALQDEKLGSILPASRLTIPYSPRKTGTGDPVPNVVYKVPTGGGKTFLAITSITRIFNKYLGTTKGFILWIVPNEAIYTQTKRQLADRRHAYRQMLDNLSSNAVKLMEKNTSLKSQDVDQNLCVMLLMLQSSNRHSKETLKIFQDRGDVYGFTPDASNQKAHRNLLKAVPNLDIYDLASSGYPWMPIRDSLGNALRIIRPVVIMDEGHKAVSELAFKTLYGFNPSFVLELTATPKDVTARSGRNPREARYQNILSEVTGEELDREEMIKMPISLDSRQTNDWRETLKASLDRLTNLTQMAKNFYANSNRYIRPILLIQVERTGADQRDGLHVHSDDVKEWLMQTGRLLEPEIAVKTAKVNDLKSPENQDLLSSNSSVRVIITKQALQEGWDCSFAYILCSLAASSSITAMTQLIGRILRQPHAKKTGIDQLDQCYIITHHTATSEVVSAIKKGLEKDGMGELAQNIKISDSENENTVQRISRDPKHRKTEILLPKVLNQVNGKKRELDLDEDIYIHLNWQELDVNPLVDSIPDNWSAVERQLVNIDYQIESSFITTQPEVTKLDRVAITHYISDIILNPWQGHEIVGKLIKGLQTRGFDEEKLGRFSSLIADKLRAWLRDQRDEMAEAIYREELREGWIEFKLYTGGGNKVYNWEMPYEFTAYRPNNARQLITRRGLQLQQSLFLPIYEEDLNQQEKDIALYLDDMENVSWWHRNISQKHYYLQGWRRDAIYPDFICSVELSQSSNRRGKRIVVLEMKGEHLLGSDDTEYKKAIFELLTQAFELAAESPNNELQLEDDKEYEIALELVPFPEWEMILPNILESNSE